MPLLRLVGVVALVAVAAGCMGGGSPNMARDEDAAGIRIWPGEVLVSSTVKELFAGSGIAFRDRGVVELKGVPGEWKLFAVER